MADEFLRDLSIEIFRSGDSETLRLSLALTRRIIRLLFHVARNVREECKNFELHR